MTTVSVKRSITTTLPKLPNFWFLLTGMELNYNLIKRTQLFQLQLFKLSLTLRRFCFLVCYFTALLFIHLTVKAAVRNSDLSTFYPAPFSL